ncbi:ead/Ea22-like family protein [Klebsiella pneumoniae]|uniref:ead/Ea22-like family protein n=1 Tax=Klebsiella pneumoniae TaxID=573 RepID=UPI00240DBF52|nr:ead/Ea22-like family protein [Klebsiella pneumoniae]WFA37097.1 ead/Ea22-like family protein [Klebsiella pneumoniae]
MTDITELAQSHELLIANGQQTADLLRHLADNEIDSDYFAVVSECESYGKETEAELSITEFALRAARYVDELVEALEKAQGMEAYWKTQCRGITDHCEELQARVAELEREQEHLRPVGVMSEQAFHRLENRECRFIALWPRPGIFLPRKRPEDGVIVYARTAAAAGIKVEAE